MDRNRALKAFNLQPTDRIPAWEHFSNPDAEEALTGIDPYEHPQLARRRMHEMTHIDVGNIPWGDDPIPRPDFSESSSYTDEHGNKSVRWGTGFTWHWNWGESLTSIEEVLKYQPLEHTDQRNADVVESRDYSRSVEDLAKEFQFGIDQGRQAVGDRCLVTGGFYNTIFMWPLLTFGWELFLELGGAYPAQCKEKLAQFAEFSRKVFKAWAMTDVEVVISHDDICFQAGPVFSPSWLKEMVYPYYEEFWGYVKEAGKKVIFMCDGNVDKVAADVFACGADGISSEPYTNWPEMVKKHPGKVYAGQGDNRTISSADRDAIFRMVKEMADTGRDEPGYMFCVGNHISWDLPVSGVLAYFEAIDKYGIRNG